MAAEAALRIEEKFVDGVLAQFRRRRACRRTPAVETARAPRRRSPASSGWALRRTAAITRGFADCAPAAAGYRARACRGSRAPAPLRGCRRLRRRRWAGRRGWAAPALVARQHCARQVPLRRPIERENPVVLVRLQTQRVLVRAAYGLEGRCATGPGSARRQVLSIEIMQLRGRANSAPAAAVRRR